MHSAFSTMSPHILEESFARGKPYRALVNADPTILSLHRQFDGLCGDIMNLEMEHVVLAALLPGGELAQHRKEWSYSGVLEDGRDFGNWGYAVIMRHLFCCGLVDHNELGDEKLGDVIEAVLHLGFGIGYREGPLFEYARLFNDVCLVLEDMQRWFVSLGYWETSRDMALILI